MAVVVDFLGVKLAAFSILKSTRKKIDQKIDRIISFSCPSFGIFFRQFTSLHNSSLNQNKNVKNSRQVYASRLTFIIYKEKKSMPS